MPSEIAVSVIVPTLGRMGSVRILLESIQRQSFQLPVEVLVVANLPDQELRSMVESIGAPFLYLEAGKLGANVARNKGIDRSSGKILLFLDDDCCLVDPNFIQKHWDRHRANPRAIGCGGRYLLRAKAGIVERAYHWIADHWLTKSLLDGSEALNLIGGNCSFKARAFENGLRFNESIRFGGAETDLCSRLIRQGETLLLFDDMSVEHRPEIGLRDFMNKAYLQGYSAGVRDIEFAKPGKVHWHATIPLEDVYRKNDLKPLFALYDKMFEYGFSLGRKRKASEAPRPPLSLVSYLLHRLRPQKGQRLKRLLYSAYLAIDRCLAIHRIG